jgi:hypothetical protein
MDVVALTSKHLQVTLKSGMTYGGVACEVEPPGYTKKMFENSREEGVLWIQDGPRTLQIDAREIAAVAQW